MSTTPILHEALSSHPYVIQQVLSEHELRGQTSQPAASKVSSRRRLQRRVRSEHNRFLVLGSCNSAAGSDMPALLQQAREDAVRDVVAGKAACMASLCKTDLRPMNLRDAMRNAPAPWHTIPTSRVLDTRNALVTQ